MKNNDKVISPRFYDTYRENDGHAIYHTLRSQDMSIWVVADSARPHVSSSELTKYTYFPKRELYGDYLPYEYYLKMKKQSIMASHIVDVFYILNFKNIYIPVVQNKTEQHMNSTKKNKKCSQRRISVTSPL